MKNQTISCRISCSHSFTASNVGPRQLTFSPCWPCRGVSVFRAQFASCYETCLRSWRRENTGEVAGFPPHSSPFYTLFSVRNRSIILKCFSPVFVISSMVLLFQGTLLYWIIIKGVRGCFLSTWVLLRIDSQLNLHLCALEKLLWHFNIL